MLKCSSFCSVFSLLALCLLFCTAPCTAHAGESSGLDARQKGIAAIAAQTAAGNMDKLTGNLAKGLEAGLTVSEIKEVLIQLYAYCGFPRSLNALNAFRALLEKRAADGIKDPAGREPSPLPADLNRTEAGARTRAELTGRPLSTPPAPWQTFAPTIDAFLKEHLFCDIFARDNLDWQSRELATISALSAMHGTSAQQKSHLAVCLNTGLSKEQLSAAADIIAEEIGSENADVTRKVLAEVLKSRRDQRP